jgi:hypothetical protein
MSNILDIYNTLIRIESNNYITKRTNVYTKKQIIDYYRLKSIELFSVIERIDATKPKYISYEINYQLYKNTECYLFTFKVLENKKYHIPDRIFQFHQPINILKRGKGESYIKAINTLKK